MRVILGSALALALSGISILCCYVFGTHLAPGNEGQLYGVLGGTADALKAILPLAIAAAITAGQTPRAAAGVVLFVAFSAYSFTSELGLYALGRDAVASEAAAGKVSFADLKQERAKIAARLKEIGPQRPAGTVRGDIAAAKQGRHYETSGECKNPTWSLERDLCAKIEKLSGELASAEEAGRLRTKDEGLAVKLEGIDVAAALRSTDAQADSLSRLTGISAASIKDGLAIMVAVLIELGSGLGLWVATAGAGHAQAKTRPADGRDRSEERAAVALPATPRAMSLACDEGIEPLRIEGPARDAVASFVKARCRKLATGEEKAAELYRAFLAWADAEGCEVLSPKALGSRLADLGFERSKRGGVVRWAGIALRG
ncbi:MAG: hypothetical protein WAN43_08940 [Rhodomicrobium sp.]